MPKKSTPRDPNQLAKYIVERSTIEEIPKKNRAAIALGRLGGLKGGPARAKKLSAKRRQAIAKKAVEARWAKNKE